MAVIQHKIRLQSENSFLWAKHSINTPAVGYVFLFLLLCFVSWWWDWGGKEKRRGIDNKPFLANTFFGPNFQLGPEDVSVAE